MNYYAAYEIGKLISQLDFYLQQACLGVTWHEKQFRAAYDELHSKVRGVVVLARDQEELQDQIARAWRKLNVDQFHSDDYCECLAAAQLEIHEAVCDPDLDIDRSRTIRNEACGTFQGLAFTFIEHVRQIIESACQQNPDAAERMSRSFSFGEFVSRALYPREVYKHMYGPWAWDVRGRSRAPTDRVIAGNCGTVNQPSGFGQTTEKRVEPNYLGTHVDPGELPIRAGWFPELRERWHEFCIGELPAEVEQIIALFLAWDRSYFDGRAGEIKQLVAALLNVDELCFGAFRIEVEKLIAENPGAQPPIRRPSCGEITKLIDAIDRGFEKGVSRIPQTVIQRVSFGDVETPMVEEISEKQKTTAGDGSSADQPDAALAAPNKAVTEQGEGAGAESGDQGVMQRVSSGDVEASRERRGGRPALSETHPKRQVYERIRREKESGGSNVDIKDRLKKDRDFMELFDAASLNWKSVFKNSRVYCARGRNKQQTRTP